MVESKCTKWSYGPGGPRKILGLTHAEIVCLPILLPVWTVKAASSGIKRLSEPKEDAKPSKREKKDGIARQLQRLGHWITNDHPDYDAPWRQPPGENPHAP